LLSSGRLDQRDGQAMTGPGVEPATPRFSVVDRGGSAGHGQRQPAKISLQIASIATCGPFRVTPRLCGLVDARGARSPGSARIRMSVVSGDASAGEASAVRPARLPPEADARCCRPGMRSGLSRRRSRVRVPSLALNVSPAKRRFRGRRRSGAAERRRQIDATTSGSGVEAVADRLLGVARQVAVVLVEGGEDSSMGLRQAAASPCRGGRDRG
jgi:hypothetical protein